MYGYLWVFTIHMLYFHPKRNCRGVWKACISGFECVFSSQMTYLHSDAQHLWTAMWINSSTFTLVHWHVVFLAGDFWADLSRLQCLNDPPERKFSFINCSITDRKELPFVSMLPVSVDWPDSLQRRFGHNRHQPLNIQSVAWIGWQVERCANNIQ